LQSKNYALGALVLLVTTAAANNQTYIVHKGDTIGTIAKHFNVPASELVSANSLNKKHLRAGMSLSIPDQHKNLAHYKVAQGDNDWVLAHRLGTTIAELKKLNPDADWRHLKIGSSLNVPSTKSAAIPKFKARFAVVNADHAIIRRGPGSDEDKITQVDTGTRVTVLNYQDGWYQLKFPKGTVGWMRGDLLKQAAPAEVASVAKPKKTVVAAKVKQAAKPVTVAAAKVAAKAIVAKAAKTATAPKTDVKPIVAAVSVNPKPVEMPLTAVEPQVPKLAEASIQTPTPVEAAAPAPKAVTAKAEPAKPAEKVRVAKSSPTDQQLLSKAYHLRGTRYVYGGLSSRGLDCSGFTTTVFRAAGIQLPRTSRSQSTIGVHVGRSDLKAGDLVFFRTGRSSRINHVGMYVGNGNFIHAASGFGAVRVDSLNGHYSHELATARRLPAVRHVVAGAEAERPASAKSEDSKAPAPKEQVAKRPEVKPDPTELPLPAATKPKKPEPEEKKG
jgi:cell wall-associated NlpC family hydrolase/LysM repeat protein